MKKINIASISNTLSQLQLSGIYVILFITFYYQIFLHELPCPLCILQRIGFLVTAMGFLMNLRFGPRPSHYSMALCGALFTGIVSLRQVALHVVPGTGEYGYAIFGIHLYTWTFIISALIIVATSIILGFDRQYDMSNVKKISLNKLLKTFFAIGAFLIIANIISLFLECSIHECPDNPVSYYFLHKS